MPMPVPTVVPEGRSTSLPAFDREHVNVALPIPDYKLRRKISLQQEESLVIEAFSAFDEMFYMQLKWRESRDFPDVSLHAVGNGSTTLVLDVHAQSPHFTYILDAPPGNGTAAVAGLRQCSPCTWSTLHTPVEVTRSISCIPLRMDRTPTLNNDKEISLEQTVTFTLMGTLWRLEDSPMDSLQCKSYRGRSHELSKSDCAASLLKNIAAMQSSSDTQPDLAIKLDKDEDAEEGDKCPVHYVHAFVLQAHSPVIRRMLACPMAEASAREIHMSDVSLDELQDFLNCLYQFSVPCEIANSDARLASVLALSDRYEVLALRDECAELMAKRLSEDNMAELLKIAEMHQALPLRMAALHFVACRAERIALVMDTDNAIVRKSVVEHLQRDEALRVASSTKATSHEITLTV